MHLFRPFNDETTRILKIYDRTGKRHRVNNSEVTLYPRIVPLLSLIADNMLPEGKCISHYIYIFIVSCMCVGET